MRKRSWVRWLAPVWLALSAAAVHADPRDITIGYVTTVRERLEPVSPLDVRASDEGLQGARLGIAVVRSAGSKNPAWRWFTRAARLEAALRQGLLPLPDLARCLTMNDDQENVP